MLNKKIANRVLSLFRKKAPSQLNQTQREKTRAIGRVALDACFSSEERSFDQGIVRPTLTRKQIFAQRVEQLVESGSDKKAAVHIVEEEFEEYESTYNPNPADSPLGQLLETIRLQEIASNRM